MNPIKKSNSKHINKKFEAKIFLNKMKIKINIQYKAIKYLINIKEI
jgi:hypothetical protein